MEPAQLLVHFTPPVTYRGDEDVPGEQLAAAEAALAVAAVSVDRYRAALKSDSDRLGCPRFDDIFLDPAQDGNSKGLSLGSLRIPGQRGYVGEIVHNIMTETSLRHTHLIQHRRTYRCCPGSNTFR